MEHTETKEFFECLGEIWRDITTIEFLMRAAVARDAGDIDKFPMPPYDKGKEYFEYPQAFSNIPFEEIVASFNSLHPTLALPKEFTELRNGMAHGIISEFNNSGIQQLVKFREKKGVLKIEFSLPLEIGRLRQLRQSLMELRRHVASTAKDPE